MSQYPVNFEWDSFMSLCELCYLVDEEVGDLLPWGAMKAGDHLDCHLVVNGD